MSPEEFVGKSDDTFYNAIRNNADKIDYIDTGSEVVCLKSGYVFDNDPEDSIETKEVSFVCYGSGARQYATRKIRDDIRKLIVWED